MSQIEIFAAIVALFGVLLTARTSIWGWFLGIVGAAIYSWLFIESALYAEGVLQSLYVLFGIYGWWSWKHFKNKVTERSIIKIDTITFSVSLFVWLLGTATCGWILSNYSNSEVPYLDSLLAVGGLMTTYLMAKKIIENWLFWIVIDIASGLLFINRELYVTALLYFAFAALAGHGYFQWNKEFKKA
jgi:nicotinamide mononucleotide transporter